MYRPAWVLLSTIAQTTATASRITRPVGKPLTLTSPRNQPLTSSAAWGQETDWVLVNTDARPLAIFMLAMDTIKGGTFQKATRYPLNTPNRKPTRMLMNRLSAMGTPWTVRQ